MVTVSQDGHIVSLGDTFEANIILCVNYTSMKKYTFKDF